MKDELKEAQELIKRMYEQFGIHPNTDFLLWKEAETYCKEKKLI